MTKAKTATANQASLQTVDGKQPTASRIKASRKQTKPARSTHNQQPSPVTAAASPTPVGPAASVTPQPHQTKAALLRARLAEPGGVSLAALMAATGWQAHTVRAALSGLRKSGVTITRRREGEDTIYASVAEDPAVTGASDDGAGENSDTTSFPPILDEAATATVAEDTPTNEVGA